MPGYHDAPAAYVNGGSAPAYQQPQQRSSYPGPPPRPGSTSSSSYTPASLGRPGGAEWSAGGPATHHGSSDHTSPERWRPSSSSATIDSFAGPAAAASQPVAVRPTKRSDPFGGAKPVDTAAVYIDGHPHHTEIAAAKLGPAAVPAAAQTTAAPAQEYLLPPQQQQQPVKLLQRPPQPLGRPDSRGESLTGSDMGSEAGRTYAQQQQQQLPPVPRQQPAPPYGHYPPHMQPQQQPHGSPFGSPGKHPASAAPYSAGPAGSSSSSSAAMYQPPDPHYSLPPPPPPPPRPVPEGTPAPAAPPAVTGVWATGVASAAAGLGGPPPPPPAAAGSAAAPAPSLQGAWAVRGGTGAPVIGYKALGSSRPGSSSGPASGPGSRRGSYSALTDDAVQAEQQQQPLSRFYGQQQMDIGYQHVQQYVPQQQQQHVVESTAPAAVPAGTPAAAADDWGVVEEFISQQPRDYSILQPDKVCSPCATVL